MSDTPKTGEAVPVSKDSVEHVVQQDQRFVKVLDLQIQPNTRYDKIDFNFTYTSFIFEIASTANFTETTYYTDDLQTFHLDSLPPTDQAGNERRSPFIVPNNSQKYFTFYSGNMEGKVRLYLFYAPPISLQQKNKLGKKTSAWCDKPEVIQGSVWREGLPAPTGKRENHKVHHCVVHHAASSNSNHDYVNVVRNIYLLHTQTNGWDDIGYNFVVAQDGSIFEGRDHQDLDSTDNIKGAHFCGKNTNTMGICVLGNYQDISPTAASVKSLTHLLTWKCFKENMLANGTSPHPTSSSPALGHVAGHQDGCATACPGDSLYRLLPDMKGTIDSILATCGNVHAHPPLTMAETSIKWFQKNETGQLVLAPTELPNGTTLSISSLSGQQVWSDVLTTSETTLEISGLNSGIYLLMAKHNGQMVASQTIRLR